jgi:hypothetical protein
LISTTYGDDPGPDLVFFGDGHNPVDKVGACLEAGVDNPARLPFEVFEANILMGLPVIDELFSHSYILFLSGFPFIAYPIPVFGRSF